ncbi:MAG: hypothetical protein JWR61_251 [Ferruginibacter sp.]|uniref:DUF4405 domain-containing protein n=1 Tax=Ferruginibacter sp. TaxID=1940288 RepID=UPI00265ABE08|nr:DUF4405 domain-containing protein [Ferruginibacter sp.]MDB5275296.1 hypothetical protein [Ferruginibacter sp.]
MKKKNIISLSIALAFLFLSVTGLLLYFGLKPEFVTSIHVLLGLIFIGFAFFHIKNNWPSLKVYTKDRKEGGIKKEFLVAAAVVGIFLLGAGFSLPPFGEIQHFGEDLTRGGGGKGGRMEKASFDKIITNKDKQGKTIQLIIEKSNEVITPVITIWTTDTAGNFIDNLFVPAKTIEVTSGEADKRHALYEGETETNSFTPAMSPGWQAATKDTATNYAEATPTDNFFLTTKTKAGNTFQLMLEIKDNGKTELYKALVDGTKSNAVALKAANGALLVRAVAELE